MKSDASDLIKALQEQGNSLRTIGETLHRDSSFISQVAKGKKPGANLVPGLRAMLEGRPVPEPEPRTKKRGGVARVRGQKD